jgi:hypothetical protein
MTPTLVENPSLQSDLVSSGMFGCALWIAPGTRDDFVTWWQHNRFPLCAGVLSGAPDTNWFCSRLPGLARLTINGDTSLESVFAPWGGYPGSGLNTVGHWQRKYQRIVQVDELAARLPEGYRWSAGEKTPLDLAPANPSAADA